MLCYWDKKAKIKGGEPSVHDFHVAGSMLDSTEVSSVVLIIASIKVDLIGINITVQF